MTSLPHFLKGQKLVYLPNVLITLVRNRKLPPTWARFQVPLNWNKFDIRDYLFHAYGVRVLHVRSYVQMRTVVLKDNKPGRWKRPKSIKWMTVEMEKPFVYPELPANMDPWYSGNSATKDRLKRVEEESTVNLQEQGHTIVPRELNNTAEMLRDGRLKWQPSWKTIGGTLAT